jgi:hypothetical protein
MLTLLSTVKARLTIDEFDVKNDALLTAAVQAVSARFDNECNRTLARAVDQIHEFNADETELRVLSYPIETVSKFELKSNEADGWVEQPDIEYLIRHNCVISLTVRLGSWREQGRVTYAGGYVLPDAIAAPGQTALPDDLEQAAVEQVAYCFQNRDHLGVIRQWPKGGIYQQFVDLDLLPGVRAVLANYAKWVA